MKIFTAHLRDRRAPVLVREGFSWGALFFGPLWLLRHGAWIAAAVSLAALVLACTAAPPPLRPVLAFGVLLLLGAVGNDLRRWTLARHRFWLVHVVAAGSADEALMRLLAHRPDLLGRAA